MDIVTHAGIGVIAASPFAADRPELALGLVAGSVLPDLDALCRLAGKRAFLQAHQTWTHALPAQAVSSVCIAVVALLLGRNGAELGAGLFAGLAGHTLLDLTNTFGVAWLAPFSKRRRCFEWIFFIDAVVLTTVFFTLALILPVWLRNEPIPTLYPAAFFGCLSAYVATKAMLRARVGHLYPEALSMVPSTLVPWRFLGTKREQESILIFRVNGLSGCSSRVGEVRLLDDAFGEALQDLPEYRLMRGASPEYHVVGAVADGSDTRVLCRDMRIRNFGTRFGDLEVWLDPKRRIIRSRFYV